MSGSKANLVNRIAGVVLHIVRSGACDVQELRGALVVFCAGCMMYVDSEMGKAAEKLAAALGGAPYLGVHTFGTARQRVHFIYPHRITTPSHRRR